MMPAADRSADVPAVVLMLTPRMTMGYGVAEAVAMQVRTLAALGVTAVVGCSAFDGHYADIRCVRVAADPDSVRDLAADVGATVVVAHGSPFFEVLPGLRGMVRTVVYEYGDPPPDLFGADAAARRAVVVHKQQEVYPNVDAVAAISAFIRTDIRWPAARVIVLGCEHVPDLGVKPAVAPGAGHGRLRVGALMRLGAGEARYKGSADLLDLAARLPQFDWAFAGRGSDADAAQLRRAGFRTLLNPTDAQRSRFLREIDVFVTLSQWEGTNLPMVEAQALGTPALALATGAHPEFCPHVVPDIAAMADRLRRIDADRNLLPVAGEQSYTWVRDRMSWSANATALLELCRGGPTAAPPPRSPWSRRRSQLRRFVTALRKSGPRAVIADQRNRRT